MVRWPTLRDMYTSEGLFTKELSFEYYQSNFGAGWDSFVWSFYWISDSPLFAQSLFAIAAVSALFLIVGKWTKVATLISWALLASLHARNPLVTTSGDFMFKMMLFWSVFLPLSARWSLDARKNHMSGDSYCSVATIAYVIQLFIVYFFPGVAKWNSTWFSGEAMSYVMRLDIYIREFGKSLLDNPELLATVSWLTLFAELVLIWTLFVSWKNGTFRIVNMIVFIAFHIGIALSLGIGIFPWICMVAWLPLLPSFVWGQNQEERQTVNTFDWNQLPLPKMAGEIFCVVALALVVTWNISNVVKSSESSSQTSLLYQLVFILSVDQHFQMFGEPPDKNPWFVYEAQLKGGELVDLWRKSEIDNERPASGLKVFPNFHWRKLHRNSLYPTNKFVRQPMLDHAIRKWNAANPEKPVIKARLICYREEIGPNYNNLNFYSDVWGKFEDKENSPGSLFEQFLKEQGDDMSF